MSRNTSVVRCIDDGAESEERAIWYNISVYKFHTFREIGGKASRSPIELIEVALPIAVKVVVLSMNLSGTYIDEDVQMLYKVDAKNWVMNLCDDKDEWELASWTEIQCK